MYRVPHSGVFDYEIHASVAGAARRKHTRRLANHDTMRTCVRKERGIEQCAVDDSRFPARVDAGSY
jgi:hypothetical protein